MSRRRSLLDLVTLAAITIGCVPAPDAGPDVTTNTPTIPAVTADAEVSATARPTSTPPPITPGRGGGVYLDLLWFIPDTPEVRAGALELGNPAAAEADFGLEFPAVTEAPFPWSLYVEYILDAPDTAANFFDADIWTREYTELAMEAFGFGPAHVQQWALVRAGPDFLRNFYVALGPFEEQAILDHLGACASCPPPDVEDTLLGWSIRGWGPDSAAIDGTRRFERPFYDQWGRGGRMGFHDGMVTWTLLTADLHLMLSAHAGDVPSLAEVPEYRAVAELLDGLGAYSASLWVDNRKVSPTSAGPFVAPYLLRGTTQIPDPNSDTGMNGLGRSPCCTLLVFDSADAARENADRLREREAANHIASAIADFEVWPVGPIVIIRYTWTVSSDEHLEFLLATPPAP